jgi:DHA1 family bicyclomycin/chloramphenicol resistance-like MFS transporter
MNTLRKRMGTREFTLLVALLSSYQALSTFALLPALPQIAADFSVTNQNDAQLVIGLFLFGNMIGQLLFGPLSDAFGRKPVIAAGFVLFFIGCVISLLTSSFWILLAGRVLQGLGAAAPRTVSLSMVRDLYSGRPMARLMSFAMGFFTLMPIIAPMLGQAAMHIAGWQGILSAFILFGVLGLLWLQVRQVESLAPEHRRRFQTQMYLVGFASVWDNRTALIYSFALGTTFAAFVGLMSSVQQIFQDTFNVGESFPYLFAVMAFSVAIASFFNSKIVIRFGMRKIVKLAMSV